MRLYTRVCRVTRPAWLSDFGIATLVRQTISFGRGGGGQWLRRRIPWTLWATISTGEVARQVQPIIASLCHCSATTKAHSWICCCLWKAILGEHGVGRSSFVFFIRLATVTGGLTKEPRRFCPRQLKNFLTKLLQRSLYTLELTCIICNYLMYCEGLVNYESV